MFGGPIVALVTPFKKEDQSIDFDVVKKLVKLHLQSHTSGIVVGGTTGEGPTLEKEELSELIATVVKEVDNKIGVLVGTGTNSTKKTVEMTLLAKEMGADGALVIVPYYNKPTDAGVLAHFREIDKLKFPFIAYHHPGRCGIELDVETLIDLSNYECFMGLKECSKNSSALRELLDRVPDINVLAGDDDRAIAMIQMGAKGCVSVIGNLYPAYWSELIYSALEGNYDEARAKYQKIKALIWAISQEVNPQGIKCAMAKAGLCEEVLRLPLLPVTKNTKEEIENYCFEQTAFETS
jgi:4-hydroxy-tetrahydrodipicolinate synthase